MEFQDGDVELLCCSLSLHTDIHMYIHTCRFVMKEFNVSLIAVYSLLVVFQSMDIYLVKKFVGVTEHTGSQGKWFKMKAKEMTCE